MFKRRDESEGDYKKDEEEKRFFFLSLYNYMLKRTEESEGEENVIDFIPLLRVTR